MSKCSLSAWFPKQWISNYYFGEPAKFRNKDIIIPAFCKPQRRDTDDVLRGIRETGSKHVRLAVDAASSNSSFSSPDPATPVGRNYTIKFSSDAREDAKFKTQNLKDEIELTKQLLAVAEDEDEEHTLRIELKRTMNALKNFYQEQRGL